MTELLKTAWAKAERLSREDQDRLAAVVLDFVQHARPLPPSGTLQQLVELLESGPHLDKEDAEQFHKDLEEMRAAMLKEPLRDPWES